MRTQSSFLAAAFFISLTALPGQVFAEEPEASGTENEVVADTAAKEQTGAKLLSEADVMIQNGKLDEAVSLYKKIQQDFPGTPAALAAKRGLQIIKQLEQRFSKPATTPPAALTQPAMNLSGDVFSRRTGETLEISIWEKLDFSATMFSYGLGSGVAFVAGFSCDGGCVAGSVAAGAAVFGGSALYYLFNMDPDRGDLPVIMAITAYLPMTTTLVSILANGDGEAVPLATSIASLVALPLALTVGHYTDLDPGDTQMARDSIFWGTGFGLLGYLGIAGADNADGRMLVLSGLIGSAVGGATGLWLSHVSDPTLERVRATTWGGYAGGTLGLLVGVATQKDRFYAIGAVAGSALGLTLGAIFSESLDEIPGTAQWARDGGTIRSGTPTILAYIGKDGRQSTMPGVEILAGTW